MKNLQNFINGQYIDQINKKYFDNFNPATAEVIAQIPDSDEKDISAAVQAAKNAFPAWSNKTPQERSKVLHAIANLIEKRLEEFAKLESLDQGKPIKLAREIEIPRAILNFRFFADVITQQEEHSIKTEAAYNYVQHMPVGVAGLISPWNLPLYLLTWKIAPALAFGNTAVCKPSEMTSMTAHLLGEIFQEAKLPQGVCNIVLGTGPKAGSALTSHPDVPLISFTGGTKTGKTILKSGIDTLKKFSLELGGKNASLVFADTDLSAAIPMHIRSSFQNQGEICLCNSRIFVEEKIYTEFLQKFIAATKKLVVGDPAQETTNMGPLVSKEHREKVQYYISLAQEEGGKIAVGGDIPKLPAPFDKGYFLNPTIITGLPYNCRTQQEEIFGPVVTVTPFKKEDEAIAWANSTQYGLSASIWSQDTKRAERVAQQIQAGTVWINTWMLRELRMPFGGMKASGMGREGGKDSLDFFTEAKTICIKL